MKDVGVVTRKIQARMDELKKAGWTGCGQFYGVPGVWFKDDKYLYLLLGRKRVYIGCDPAAVSDAMAGVDRAREYYELQRRLNDLADWIEEVIFLYPSAAS